MGYWVSVMDTEEDYLKQGHQKKAEVSCAPSPRSLWIEEALLLQNPSKVKALWLFSHPESMKTLNATVKSPP